MIDSLIARRTELAIMNEIPDVAAYALEWEKLAADFEAKGWKANAEICQSNARRYKTLALDLQTEENPVVRATRELHGSYAELVPDTVRMHMWDRN